MMKKNSKTAALIFLASLVAAFAILLASIIKNNAYNAVEHRASFSGENLFSGDAARSEEVAVIASARNSTWSKAFDFFNEGITEHNYQAYTIDFTVANHTGDEVEDFSFRLTFDQDSYLASAWNGSLEIHQLSGGEIVDTVPDLREFVPENHILATFSVDGETMVAMKPGDYLIYNPSTSMNAMEMPIEPMEATTPGFIMYMAIGAPIEGLEVELDYTFHRALTREPLFWVSMIILAVWLVAIINFGITSAQIRKYNIRHERDNEIINESIETFTGFIDAKDPYTNGHSKRVATYTKRIAKEFGYDGEALDRIYYVALLHDCGKIGVPDSILGKPGRLTDEEYQVIKSHTVRGGEILSSFKSLNNVGEGALYHHERYDGNGYPSGKAGEEIPFIARMICVADSFDAMNTNRVYRDKRTKEHILEEIESNRGRQFDPQIADVMLGLIRSGQIKAGE